MNLSQRPTDIKRRQTMIRKLGSMEAYMAYMRTNGSQGGKARVPKGYSVTRKKQYES